jgi:uncharacterized protein YigE (DUF2233 family)
MKHIPKLFILTSVVVIFSLPQSTRSIPEIQDWKVLDPGLEYGTIQFEEGLYKTPIRLKVLKVDPHRYPIRILPSKDYNERWLSAKEFATKSGAIATINGGFFLSSYEPLGLIIQNSIIINKMSRADWGIFLIENGEPKVIHTRDYQYNRSISQALQVGPRLVVNGRVLKLKNQVSRRSALGVTKNKKLVFLVSDNSVVYADDLAKIMRSPLSEGGLECESALNLDGGPSSQFYIHYGEFEDFVEGGWGVPNAIGVFPMNAE